MLGKLIKYDFKWINKVMYIYFAIFAIITVAVKVIESLEQTFFIVVLDKIISGMFIAMAINIVITCFMRIWVRFIHNFYKDESYLTHTLPITKNKLFNAKIISSILSILLSVIVVIACVAIIYLNETTIYSIKAMFESLVNVYGNITAVLFVLGLVSLVLLEIIYAMMSGIFGIILGYKSNNNKILKSVAIGIGSYGVLSIISLVIIKIMNEFLDFEIVAEGFPSIYTLKIMGLTFIIVYIMYNLVYYFVSKHLFNKGVNID